MAAKIVTNPAETVRMVLDADRVASVLDARVNARDRFSRFSVAVFSGMFAVVSHPD